MTTLTRSVKRFEVLLARRTGAGRPPVPADYPAWEAADRLQALSVRQVTAPGVSAAKLVMDVANWQAHVWTWRDMFALDDRVAVVEDSAEPDRLVLFVGFIAEADMRFGRDEDLTLTANSNAWRLRRDCVVHGRWMLAKNQETVTHYNGLPCQFNAGGRPNRHAVLQPVAGGPERGVPVFTFDDAPTAVHWNVADILDYLMWRYNAGQTWIANATLYELDYGQPGSIVAAAEGLSLWDALAAACDAGGYDAWEDFYRDEETGGYRSRIAVCQKHSGMAKTVKHQAPNPDGTRPQLNLNETNLFAASVAESNANAVARPVVAGGLALYEITIELAKAWESSRLEIPAGEHAYPDTAGLELTTYHKRYVTRGELHWLYADAGRLWDANTDGRYAGSPYNRAVPDVAALAGLAAGSWPRMPYAPRPCLTYATASGGKASIQAFLEWSCDGGTTWTPLDGWDILPDRLGVRLTTPNLAAIRAPGALNPYTDNLFWHLANNAANTKVRLTCTVAAPTRNIVQPAWREGAGTQFDSAEWYDRGGLHQVRVRAAGSRFAGGDLPADTSDGAGLIAQADAIQAASEMKALEAGLAIEWPDEPIGISDVILEIEGLGYSLCVRGGGQALFPRVIGKVFELSVQTYSLALILDTERKAGIV